MTKKMADLFYKIITKSSVWFILILWHLLDSSNYKLEFFCGNLIVSLFIITIVTLITNRLPFAILLTLALEAVLNFASAIKAEFFATILTYYDLIFLFNIYNLSGEDFVFSYLTMSFVIYTILMTFAILYLFFKIPVFVKANYFARIIMMISAIFILKLALSNIRDEKSYISTWLKSIRVKNIEQCNQDYESQNIERAICYGMGPFLDVVSGISENQIKLISTKSNSDLIKQRSKKQDVEIATSENELPNVILVLNESTFDPIYLDYEFAKNLKFNFFSSPLYLKASGVMKVHTFGGGSSLSEFPSVTGIIHDIFTGPVTYPFLNIAELAKVSVFRELKKLGYYSIVIYPQDKRFINAEHAFKTLGADKVVGTSDYNYKPEDWRGVSENFISKMIDEEIKQAPANMPVFISVATIRNHGPHQRDMEDKIGCRNDMSDIMCSKLNDYIERLKQTDQEWTEYTNKIMEQQQKTMIIHFGDHLPSFEGEMDDFKFKYSDITKQDIFRTFYNIRANFEIKDYSYPVLDISYLPSMILDILGANNSEFYKASSYIRDKCNGLLLECKEHELLESYESLIAEQIHNITQIK